ncbi:hypothetical protein WT24_29595 [Burkholderia sp. MSMB1078WGS]|nr:hypothetical protein WT24_29595 [Burkholderia sp. MSMB1078WGS]
MLALIAAYQSQDAIWLHRNKIADQSFQSIGIGDEVRLAKLLIELPYKRTEVSAESCDLSSILDTSIDYFCFPKPRYKNAMRVCYNGPCTQIRELVEPTFHRSHLRLMCRGALL